MKDGLDAIFRPRSVAVVGASRDPGSVGAALLRNLLATGYDGPVYPVNPSARAVQAVRAYASVEEIPDEVDLAVIAVPQRQVSAVAAACARKGVRGLVVVSAGFAETGEEGRRHQDQLRAFVREHGMRMVGPNCLGVMNADPAVKLNATFARCFPPAGNVAVASQSGAVALALLDRARELGIGMSQFVSTGNKADVSGNDLLEHWESDDGTQVILLYLESLGNPRRFLEIARRVSRRKPIVVVKSGRSTAGARAAASHTGALATTDVAVDALLAQAGVLRTDTIEEMFDLAVLLSAGRIPRGGRVAIVTNGGGPGIMAADACEAGGLAVAPLAPATTEALRRLAPPEAGLANPVDLLASAPPERYGRAAELLLHDENVDVLLALFVPTMVTGADSIAAALVSAAAGSDKPVLASFLGSEAVAGAAAALRAARIPTFAFPESAVRALARAVAYGRWRNRPAEPVWEPPPPAAQPPPPNLGPTRWLAPDEVRAVLTRAGLEMPREELARDERQAIAAATRIGFPVALKLVAAEISHKTEVGGVQLGLRSADDVARAFAAIRAGLERRGLGAALQGVLVQQMVEGGVETYAGMVRDDKLGPLLAFGIGGIAVELWRDVVFRVSPLTAMDAHDMITGVRGRRLLEGFRGAPPVDEPALAAALLRLDALVTAEPRIVELDINPLVAFPAARPPVALDARIRILSA